VAEKLDVDGDGVPDATLYPADCPAPPGVFTRP
jgi:hypothetical protein